MATATRNDNLFVKLVRKDAPRFKNVSTSTMVKTAKQTCKFMRSGWGILDAVDLMEDYGFSSDEGIAFVAGAIVFYCPEQEGNY